MQVLRVEDADGWGPFQSYDWTTPEVIDSYNDNPDFPSPRFDGMYYPDWEPIFGVSCEDQFKHWFPEPIAKALCDHGYRLATYEVEDEDAIVRGGHQVAFDRDRARLIATRSPLEPHWTQQ